MRWPKYWSFSFSISHSNEYSGLISFRIDWLDLLAVQGTLKSLLQQHSSNASILWRSGFFSPSLTAQRLKHLPPMGETWVRSLSREDPLEKEMETHSSILAWRIPWMEEPGRLQSTGSQRVGHNWATSPHLTSPHLTAFFTVQLSHPYMTTWKTIALTRGTFVGKGLN